MNFSLSLVLFSLSLSSASYEKCSEGLEEAFRREFEVAKSCVGCIVLSPRIIFAEESWAGYCVGEQLYLFRDWKCAREIELLNLTQSVAVLTNESCEFVRRKRDLDEKCLKIFNDKICNCQSDVQNQNKGKGVWERETFSARNHTPTTAESSTSEGRNSTKSAPESKTSTTMTSTLQPTTKSTKPTTHTDSSTTLGSTEAFTSSTTHRSSPNNPTTTFSTTVIPPGVIRANCEINEYFYNNHCYFLKYGYIDLKVDDKPIPKPSYTPDANSICQSQHPKALGLAVETKEENTYIMDLAMALPIANFIVLTSGVRRVGFPDEWRGWNITINRNVLQFNLDNDSNTYEMFYCIDACKRTWYLLNSSHLKHGELVYVICKRPYNPKNIQLELHERCLMHYRKSPCYNVEQHTNYCCGMDETRDLWFSCPGNMAFKNYAYGISCKWFCEPNGFFVNSQPTCKGFRKCESFYQGIHFIAPPTRYAISSCPPGYWGNSTWYCTWNTRFLRTPDFSFCCRDRGPHRTPCRDTDSFLNVWVGCPSDKASKKTACPAGSAVDEAVVEWYCEKNGSFRGNEPDYSNCNSSEIIICKKRDRFNTEWKAEKGTTIYKKCPPGFNGTCSWYCKDSGEFDGPEPDCSRCIANWMNEITDKIKNETHHVELMEIMENYTEKEDLTIGYSYVLNLTADCVTLFKKQASENKINVFDKFLKSYSKILRNVAGNPKIWSNFSVLNRREYSEQILNTTETAAFARLETGNEVNEQYNETFAKSSVDGFDFFVAYNPPMGSVFPLKNFSESDWHLHIEEINDTYSNFAAMGLVMNYSLSSLMFPRGSCTKKICDYYEVVPANQRWFIKFCSSRFDFTDSNRSGCPLELDNDTKLVITDRSDFKLNIQETGNSSIYFVNSPKDIFRESRKLPVGTSISKIIKNNGVQFVHLYCSGSGVIYFYQGCFWNQTENLEINAPALTFTVAASMDGKVVIDPNVAVSVSFKHIHRTRMPETLVIRRRLHDGEQPSGVFNSTLCFYYRDSDWSTEGCSVTFTSRDRTNCTCNHLSTIGVLMSIHKYEPNLTLETISAVSSGITIISLIFTLLVFYFFDKVSNERLLIGKNLCFCLLFGHVMLITVLDKKFFNIPDHICTAVAILLHYIFMAAFSWMFVEGYHLYRMLVVVFDSGIEYRLIYLFIGYGMPFVVVGVTQIAGLILHEQPYGQDEVCWLKSPVYVWAFLGPVIVLTSINFYILVTAMKLAWFSKRRTERSNSAMIRWWMKTWVSLSALLGITWMFGLAYFNYNEPLVYAFVLFNGLQGFFIFLFRCVLCEQYKTLYLNKMKSWFSKSKSEIHKKTGNVKSETKLFAISGTKSDSKDSGFDPGVEDGQKYLVGNSSEQGKKIKNKHNENLSAVDTDGNITLTPAISEAYLRNKMIAKNFSVRKSKATLLADEFPELSYHTLYHPE